jgi:hypothetical protein
MSTSEQHPADDWRPLSPSRQRTAVRPVESAGVGTDVRTDRRAPVPSWQSEPDRDGRRRAAPDMSVGRPGVEALAPRSRELRRVRVPGLTPPTAAVLCAVPILLGGLLDAWLFGHLSWFFGIGFVVGAIWQAGRLRAPDLVYAGILPPLVFAGSALVLHQFLPAGNSGNIVVREALDLASTLASSAPLLFTGTLLAIALAAVRWRHERARRKRRHRARV